MFQGDQTKDHFSPCEGPILLWSSFLVSFHFHFNPFFFLWVSFQFIFLLHFFWIPFPAFSLCFCLLIFLEGVSLTELHFFSYLPSSIRHLIAYSSRGDFFSPLPLNMEGDPWSGYKRKFIRFKRGDYG